MTDLISGGIADKALTAGLTGLATRQRAISNNLANVDTPGFKASEVRFETQLQRAIGARGDHGFPVTLVSSHPGHIGESSDLASMPPDVDQINNTTVRVDGNNVDVDREMVQLADTTVSYNALVQLVSARISLTRYIVNEGRR